jgi:NAD-reducing hydrogenase large subunit
MDSDPKDRNILGVIKSKPELGRGGVQLPKFGQRVIETVAGKRVHPGWVVPGGVNAPLTQERRDLILSWISEAPEVTLKSLHWFKQNLEN